MVETPEEFDGKEQVDRWLAEQVVRFGEQLLVVPLEPADHARIDPFAELGMRGVPPERIIPIVIDNREADDG